MLEKCDDDNEIEGLARTSAGLVTSHCVTGRCMLVNFELFNHEKCIEQVDIGTDQEEPKARKTAAILV